MLSGNEAGRRGRGGTDAERVQFVFMVIIIAGKLVQQQWADGNGTGRRWCE